MEADSNQKRLIQWAGFFIGPSAAILCLCLLPTEYRLASDSVDRESNAAVVAEPPQDLPEAPTPNAEIANEQLPTTVVKQFSWAGRATLASMVWMGIWWLTEAVPISVTALLPLGIFPLLGVNSMADTAFPYANHLIFLYFGGFIVALSMQRWGLGKRIALLTLRVSGTTAPQMIAGFMLVTAVLSAFVSNTATTAMMLPIALSTVALLRKNHDDISESEAQQFATCLLLCIAYAASIGGVMTVIGTPPNAFLIGFLANDIAEPYQIKFSFVGWLPIGGSLVLVLLPIVYWLMTRVLFRVRNVHLSGGSEMIARELNSLGTVRRGEWNTLAVFLFAVVCWLVRPLLTEITFEWGGQPIQPLAGLTDSGIAMIAALLLFVIPVHTGERRFTMDWDTAMKVPWGILLLFGGGLSLAAAVKSNGVAEYIGSYAGAVGQLPSLVVVIIVTAAIVFLTELTSNLATTTSLVPVLAALAPAVGIHPFDLIIPATLAASCAFMLPVATPPNAIVFGSGEIEMPQMVRTGMVLNVVSVVVVTIVATLVIKPWLGI